MIGKLRERLVIFMLFIQLCNIIINMLFIVLIFVLHCMPRWPSGLWRQTALGGTNRYTVLVHECGRGFEPHPWQIFIFRFYPTLSRMQQESRIRVRIYIMRKYAFNNLKGIANQLILTQH